MHSLKFVGLLFAFSAAAALAQDAAPSNELDQVKAAVEMRRKMREDAMGGAGFVAEPLTQPDSWYTTPRELKIENRTVLSVAGTIATLARKEVFISGRVTKRMLTVDAGVVTSDKAFEKVQEALQGQGIAVVPVGNGILFLTDLSDVKK
jgi:hypothetical protein